MDNKEILYIKDDDRNKINIENKNVRLNRKALKITRKELFGENDTIYRA
jgi:hypothetical protein